jgi:hypothetical protein
MFPISYPSNPISFSYFLTQFNDKKDSEKFSKIIAIFKLIPDSNYIKSFICVCVLYKNIYKLWAFMNIHVNAQKVISPPVEKYKQPSSCLWKNRRSTKRQE